MIIALVQAKTIWENVDANIKKIEKIISRYQNVDLYLFPEMSVSGFSMNTDRFKEEEKTTVSRVMEMAGEFNTAVGVGWVKAGDVLCENHYTIVTGEEELLDYTKIHPFGYAEEDLHFAGGREIKKCRYKGFNIGVQICYDLRFGDVFSMAAKDTDLVVVPANWPAVRAEQFECLLQARAIEHQIYVAGVNCAGNIGGIYYSGDSDVFNPEGARCKKLLVDEMKECAEEKVLIYHIENDITKFREAFPVRQDRVAINEIHNGEI